MLHQCTYSLSLVNPDTATYPQIALPMLSYVLPTILDGMASNDTPPHQAPNRKMNKREAMLEEIKLRVAEVRRRIEMLNKDDEQIESMLVRLPREQRDAVTGKAGKVHQPTRNAG